MGRKPQSQKEVTYKFVEHAKFVEGLFIIEPAKQRLDGTGFDNILKLMSPANHCINLLTAVVDKYDIEKRCLKFGDINLFFGLGDVLRIMGIPIDGKPVIERDVNGRALCDECLGTDEPFNEHTGGISLVWLREYCDSHKDHALEGKDLDYYMRALVLYLIGSVIIPSSSHVVAPVYLLFLKNIEEIGSYAWGAALLANLHRNLENHIKYRAGIYANVHFLTVFILEHIPKVANCVLYLEHMDNLPSQFPLLVGWHEMMKKSARKSFDCPSVAFFRSLFNDLQQNDIEWTPYDRLPKDFLPGRYALQMRLERAFTSLLCMEKAVIHDPGVSTGRQLSLCDSDHKLLLCEAHAKHDAGDKDKNRQGGKRNWPQVHGAFVKAWNDRLQHLYTSTNDAGEEETHAVDPYAVDDRPEEDNQPTQRETSQFEEPDTTSYDATQVTRPTIDSLDVAVQSGSSEVPWDEEVNRQEILLIQERAGQRESMQEIRIATQQLTPLMVNAKGKRKRNEVDAENMSSEHLQQQNKEVRGEPAEVGSLKKLLILDINGVLASIKYKSRVKPRPFVKEFLKFCFEKYAVAIWSSKMKHNIDKALPYLGGDINDKFLFVWDQNRCKRHATDSKIFLKNLEMVWAVYKDYNPTNTLLVDDTRAKVDLNPEYNFICPESFDRQNDFDNALGKDGVIRIYLENLVQAKNVQEYIKNNPFL